jgi:hypothetical protein
MNTLRRYCFIAFIALFVSSCSSNTVFNRPVQSEDIEYLNNQIGDKQTTVILEDGTPAGAPNFRAHRDSIEWGQGSQHTKVGFDHVLRVDLQPISIPPRIASGFILGAGVGAIYGGYKVLWGTDPKPTTNEAVETLAISVGVGMAAGSVLGLLKGVISQWFGAQDRYYLDWPKYQVDSIVDAYSAAKWKK